MPGLDFNADLGESFGLWRRGADQALMAVISSANVACGFHAGDPGVIRDTIQSAHRHAVAVGAHPGLPDLLGFGRREMKVGAREVRDYVLYQVGALDAFVRAAGLRLHHVKPHGALYTMALDDRDLSLAIVEAVAEYDPGLPVYTLAGSETWEAAAGQGIRAVAEFFADRPLRKDGSVVMFGWEEHLAVTPDLVAARVRSLLTTGTVASLEGPLVQVRAETVCVHSDTPGAAEIGPAVKAAIESCGRELSSDLDLLEVTPGGRLRPLVD